MVVKNNRAKAKSVLICVNPWLNLFMFFMSFMVNNLHFFQKNHTFPLFVPAVAIQNPRIFTELLFTLKSSRR